MIKNSRFLITGVDTAVVKMLQKHFQRTFPVQSKGIFLIVVPAYSVISNNIDLHAHKWVKLHIHSIYSYIQ